MADVMKYQQAKLGDSEKRFKLLSGDHGFTDSFFIEARRRASVHRDFLESLS